MIRIFRWILSIPSASSLSLTSRCTLVKSKEESKERRDREGMQDGLSFYSSLPLLCIPCVVFVIRSDSILPLLPLYFYPIQSLLFLLIKASFGPQRA
ncbi:hypothetical protein AOLI_G00170800 [Acnodon oligacanthus]